MTKELRKYDVQDEYLDWRKIDETHPYVKDLAEKERENIYCIREHVDGDIEIEYEDGKIDYYQNVFGSFVYQYTM